MTEYRIDPRRNWTLMVARMANEPDALVKAHMQTVVDHARFEAAADFDSLMATVSPQASYHSYSGDPDADAANSPQGKDGVAAYYRMIVESGLHRIEHKTDRIIADREHILEEGVIKMAYPGAVLQMMGNAAADAGKLYVYQSRLVIIWGFDEDGLVKYEDSYAPPGGFEGILDREIGLDQIYPFNSADY